MSTWEERMAVRAQERIRAERERELARIRAEMQAEQAELEEQFRPVREAGPPGGCHECWQWAPSPYRYGWAHGDSVQPGPPPPPPLEVPDLFAETAESDWCWHACHGDDKPLFCGPIAMAAAG